jgi:hypothetical protein
MYNHEEAKQIRQEFWNKFTVISEIRRRKSGKSRHWILHHTGVPALNLKFDINETEKWVSVGFEVKSKNIADQLFYYYKLQSLKPFIEKALGSETLWEDMFGTEKEKLISRVHLKLSGVSIFERENWPEMFDFMYDKMMAIEDVFIEYKDFIEMRTEE